MKVAKNTIAKRYSIALFDAASSAGALHEVASDLSALRDIFEENASCMKLMLQKSSPSTLKVGLLNAMLSGVKLHHMTRNFLNMLIEHNRMYALPEIKSAFFEELETHNGELRVLVVSAVDVGPDEYGRLDDELGKIFNKRIILSFVVDHTMLGGIIVKVGSMMFDATLKNKLLRIKKLALQG